MCAGLPPRVESRERFERLTQDGPVDAGLEPQSTRGMEYNPLTRRYRLSGNTDVNYLVVCCKPA